MKPFGGSGRGYGVERTGCDRYGFELRDGDDLDVEEAVAVAAAAAVAGDVWDRMGEAVSAKGTVGSGLGNGGGLRGDGCPISEMPLGCCEPVVAIYDVAKVRQRRTHENDALTAIRDLTCFSFVVVRGTCTVCLRGDRVLPSLVH